MLRITVLVEPDATTLKLEGRLAGPWVGELERCWGAVRAAPPDRLLRLDLSAVTFVDTDGKHLLGRMHRQGARLEAAGLLVQSILEQIVQEQDGSTGTGLPESG